MANRNYTHNHRVLKPNESECQDKNGNYYYRYREQNKEWSKPLDVRRSSLDELRKEVDKQKKDIVNGIDLSLKNITFEEAYNLFYLKGRDKKVKRSTFVAGESYYKFIRPYIGEKKVRNLKPYSLESIAHEISETGGKEYSKGYIKNAFSIIHNVLQKCVENDVITKNPADNISETIRSLFDKPEKEKIALTESQIEKLKEFISQDAVYSRYEFYIRMSLYYGFRVGEALGLSFGDYEDGKITVHNTFCYKKNKGGKEEKYISSETKNGTIRELPVTPEIHELIAAEKERQIKNGLYGKTVLPVYDAKNRKVEEKSCFMFLTNDGDIPTEQSINQMLGRMMAKYNNWERENAFREGRQPILIDEKFSSHCFRHTSITRKAYGEWDIKDNAKFHGDKEATISQYYIHADKELDFESMKKLLEKTSA